MEQDKKMKWSYWSIRGAIVAMILLLCVAAFEFFTVCRLGRGGEFCGLITIVSGIILVILYFIYFFLGIPVILKSRSLKLNQATSRKRAIWLGLKLGLIPFSVGTILVLREFYNRWTTGIVGSDDLFFATIYSMIFTLIVILIGWIIGKIKFKNQ
jgi:uncharacterized membrane protein